MRFKYTKKHVKMLSKILQAELDEGSNSMIKEIMGDCDLFDACRYVCLSERIQMKYRYLFELEER